jgi:IS30 family transposase
MSDPAATTTEPQDATTAPNTPHIIATTIKRKPGRPRKLRGDPEKKEPLNRRIVELREKGNTITEIGQIVGLDPSNVYRRIQRIIPEKQAIEQYKKNEVSIAESLLSKNYVIKHYIADALIKDAENKLFDKLEPNKKAELWKSVAISSGIEKDNILKGLGNTNIGNIFNIVILEANKQQQPKVVQAGMNSTDSTDTRSAIIDTDVGIHNTKDTHGNSDSEHNQQDNCAV